MTMVKQQLDYLVTVTEQAGISATLDPPRVVPPGAWIAARRLDDTSLCGRHSIIADIFLITRDTGILPALESLDTLLETLLNALDEDDSIEVTDSALDESVTLPHGAAPLPAYRIQVSIS